MAALKQELTQTKAYADRRTTDMDRMCRHEGLNSRSLRDLSRSLQDVAAGLQEYRRLRDAETVNPHAARGSRELEHQLDNLVETARHVDKTSTPVEMRQGDTVGNPTTSSPSTARAPATTSRSSARPRARTPRRDMDQQSNAELQTPTLSDFDDSDSGAAPESMQVDLATEDALLAGEPPRGGDSTSSATAP
jgi:hypothetical protein